MKGINHRELEIIIERGYETKEPLMIWGRTGIGKSTTVKKVAKKKARELGLQFSDRPEDYQNPNKFIFIDKRLSQIEPTDTLGLPFINNTKDETRWIPPNWLPRHKDSKGFIFLDELPDAPESTRKAAYQLILDGRLGDWIKPEGIYIIAAGNIEGKGYQIFPFPNPLLNRFCHVELKIPSIEDWKDWALENKIDVRIINYIAWRGMEVFHKEDNAMRDRAFPTGRTWEKASNLIKNVEDYNLIELFVSAAVGQGIAHEFVTWIKSTAKVDIEEILENPKKIRKLVDEEELSLLFATLSALVSRYKGTKESLQIMAQISLNLPPEFGMLFLREIKMMKENFFLENIRKLPEWKKLAPEIAKYCMREE